MAYLAPYQIVEPWIDKEPRSHVSMLLLTPHIGCSQKTNSCKSCNQICQYICKSTHPMQKTKLKDQSILWLYIWGGTDIMSNTYSRLAFTGCSFMLHSSHMILNMWPDQAEWAQSQEYSFLATSNYFMQLLLYLIFCPIQYFLSHIFDEQLKIKNPKF